MELAIDMLNTWRKEGERVLARARGSYAPYKIRNYTGTVLHIWSDTDGSNEHRDSTAVKISNGQTIDWRFDDWRTIREVHPIFYIMLVPLCDITSIPPLPARVASECISRANRGNAFEVSLWIEKEGSHSRYARALKSCIIGCSAKSKSKPTWRLSPSDRHIKYTIIPYIRWSSRLLTSWAIPREQWRR